jgi:hypothetical protein
VKFINISAWIGQEIYQFFISVSSFFNAQNDKIRNFYSSVSKIDNITEIYVPSLTFSSYLLFCWNWKRVYAESFMEFELKT